jgi:hypothetical protein
MSRVHNESRTWAIRNAVDKIEDVKTPEFNKAQQRLTSCPHLVETEAIENRALSREAGNVLGTGALPSGASLNSITWKGEVVELCGILRNCVYNSDYIWSSERPVRVPFALIPHDLLHYITKERTCH